MGPFKSFRLLLITMAIVQAGWIAGTGAAPGPLDAATLIARVGDRVAAYYQRVQQLICVERSTVVPIGDTGNMPAIARTVESELRLEIDGTSDAKVTRAVQRINGREPRERDRKDRSGCTDPT